MIMLYICFCNTMTVSYIDDSSDNKNNTLRRNDPIKGLTYYG